MNNSKANSATNRLTTLLFIIYVIVLCWILLLKLGVRFSYMAKRQVNLIPFNQLSSSHDKIDVGEIILNILIFVPLGIYTGILFQKWRFGKKLSLVFFISLLVEGLQFILAVGAFDSTDVITNTFGGLIGLLLFNAMEKAFHDRFKAQKIINIIAAIGTVVMILLLVLLKMNMLPVRYQ